MKITVLTIEEAVGRAVSHDMTKIDATARTKGARFKKGHVITPDDLETLRDMGKEHISVMELEEGEIHEDDAALRLAAKLRGANCAQEGPSEGRINLVAEIDGFLSFDESSVERINDVDDWLVATLAPDRPVKAGQIVAGFRIHPLITTERTMREAEKLAKPISVLPFRGLSVGVVTTGKEIADGRVADAFAAKLHKKLETLGGGFAGQRFSTDDAGEISREIEFLLDSGADIVICTGGMSVDPDDKTPGAIRSVCGEIALQGVPMLPGAMLMLGWAEWNGSRRAVIGAPACVAYDERTALDRLLPYLFAGVDPATKYKRWGVGGLCERCDPCRWPTCTFGAR